MPAYWVPCNCGCGCEHKCGNLYGPYYKTYHQRRDGRKPGAGRPNEWIKREKLTGPKYKNVHWRSEHNGVKLAPGFKGYVTASGKRAPSLHPNKYYQRKDLAERIPKKGVILELFAGKGNVSKHVYRRKAKRMVLIDLDNKSLSQASRKLRGVQHETFAMDNVEFCKTKLNEVNGLALVDFDAFGSPADVMKSFFKNYEIKRPLLVGVTDGSHVFLARKSNTEEGRAWVRRKYGVNIYPNTRETQVRIMDSFIREQGQKHGFKARRINAMPGESHAVYMGYSLVPS